MAKVIRQVLLTMALASLSLDARSQDWVFSVQDAVQQWSESTGVTVLPSARQSALTAAARELGKQALAHGVPPITADELARPLFEGGNIASSRLGFIGKWDTGSNELELDDTAQADAIRSSMTVELVALQLRSLPRIVIVIDPVPPRDYLIIINEQSARPSEREKEIFAVEPGLVAVQVTRKDKPTCIWKGELTLGDEQSVHCKM